MEIRNGKMYMTRADDEAFTVSTRNKKTKEFLPFVDGDTVYFTVKKSIDHIEKEIQKVVTFFDEGKAVIEIDSIDTKDMEYGEYVYDIQLTDRDGKTTTLRKYRPFIIEGEVTYE